MGIAGATPSIRIPSLLPKSPVADHRERLLYIQAMRAVAIFIVVATHCRDPFLESTFIRSDEVGVLFRHINIIFIFISGFLFQFLLRRFDYFHYLETKLRNVIFPYMVCSIPAIVAYIVGIKSPDSIDAPMWVVSTSKLVFYMLATGTHLAPFWFIPMMTLVYSISPALVRMDRAQWGYVAIVPLLMVSLLVGRSTGDSNPVENFLFYLPVYVIGMAVSRYRTPLMPQLSRYAPVLMLAIALPLIGIAGDRWLDNVEFLTKIVFCLGLTGMFARYSRRLPLWVDYLGTISFGVYFIHYYMVAALTMASKSVLSGFFASGPIAYLVTVVVVLGLSIMGVMLVKVTAGRYSRMIIGA